MKEITNTINKLEVLTNLVNETLADLKATQAQQAQQVELSKPKPVPSEQPGLKLVTDNKVRVTAVPTKESYSLEEKQLIALSSVALAGQAAVQFLQHIPQIERATLLEELLKQLTIPGSEQIKEDIATVSDFADLLQLAVNKVFNLPSDLIN